jgi:type I restriction enzyme R subunit
MIWPFSLALGRILEIRQQNEQTIDRHTIDDVLYAGFDASAVEKAQARVKDFRAWIEQHKNELTALQVLYAGTLPLKLSLKDLRQLRDAPQQFQSMLNRLWE